ncbi:SRPBCC family protein [Mycolicibacterium goodii]|uniref:SRPBCC family protein n=1 Tax=Mycolicibacterium goodii TaxID=134601 RepID=UPI001BDD73AA|nr:SRPBCC family protein [Mycolicibacterium goodii]MBU8811344.1 SRPBCC family protein [Mycolicibacterium goodii]MBU8831858.1 SRPBCC family protein [Mycolicibacterium goodii]ULN45407.1 SRPBCC family protein [Mycolicibacterium goodii]
MSTAVAKFAVGIAVLYAARRYYRNWGTTKEECGSSLLGDRLVRSPCTQSTEGVEIDAPPASVWTVLTSELHLGENPAVGDVVHLWTMAGLDLPTLTVEQVVAGEAIVLQGQLPEFPWSAVWSFHVVPHWEDRCRLLLRMRAAFRRPGDVFLTELAGPVTALSARAMLRRVKESAESTADRRTAQARAL